MVFDGHVLRSSGVHRYGTEVLKYGVYEYNEQRDPSVT